MIELTNRDLAYMTQVIDLAATHSSGGSYDMVAMWVKASQRIIGFNDLNRPASTGCAGFKRNAGFHAELHSWVQKPDMRGGTLYVVGRRSANNSLMRTTRPCVACAPLVQKLRFCVFIEDNRFVKVRSNELVEWHTRLKETD